jgi:hypothetical protein
VDCSFALLQENRAKFFIKNEIYVKIAQSTIEYEKSFLVRNQKKRAFCYCFFKPREGAHLKAFK